MKIKLPVLAMYGALGGAVVCANAVAGEGRELLFSAPVQQLDRSLGTVTVLGQTFSSSTDNLAIGQVVNVYGVLSSDGTVTNTVVSGTSSYGANGDPVFVKGVVTNSDPILGRIEVDGMSIDYTSQLSKPGFVTPSSGDLVEFAASQPAQKGLLVAIATGSDAYSAGMTGGGTSMPGGVGTIVSAAGSSQTSAAAMTGGGITGGAMTGGGITGGAMTGGGITGGAMTGGGVTGR